MQVLPIAVLILMGGAFGAALHAVVPSFKPELGLFLFGLPFVLTMTWPSYLKLNVRSMLNRCPICGARLPAFHAEVHARGLLLDCPNCEGSFILKGEWRLKNEVRTFHCDGEGMIEVLSTTGEIDKVLVMRWPKPFAGWTEKKSPSIMAEVADP